MEEEVSEQFSDRNKSSTRKGKRNLSKEVKNALKSKRKVSKFIEKIGASGVGIRHSRSEIMDDDDISDELEVLFDDRVDTEDEIVVIDKVPLENITFVSNKDEIGECPQENDDPEVSECLPYMREFDIGIQYRKLNCNSILVSIDPFKKLYFAGKALVQVIKGVIDICGYQFGVDGKKYTVFSAKGHSSLVCVKTIARHDDKATNGECEQLTLAGSCGVSLDELQSSQGALIILEGFENEWCDGIRNAYPEVAEMIGPSITGIGPGRLPQLNKFMDKVGFRFVKSTSSNAEKYKLLEVPPYWNDIFRDLTTQFDCASGRICLFGGKGVGKSTFVKWLSNRYLSRGNGTEVLFIDLDPGQTEFTPPGVISVHVCTDPILGPNFTHLKDPTRSIYLGSINVADIPISYIRGVVDLYEFCASNERFLSMPWIINTMGFSQGLGVHLACEIIKIIRPNCVIQLNIRNDRRAFPFLLNKENVSRHKTFLSSRLPAKYQEPLGDYNFLSVKSVCDSQHVWGPRPKTSREMVLISYFAEKIGLADGFKLRSVVPLRVPLDSIAIGTVNSDLTYDQIILTLNGNLVALCEMSESHFKCVLPDPQEGFRSPKKLITNAADFTNNCVGYGIVRAYDKQAEILYVVTPVSEADILLKVNVILAAGAIGLPIQFYAEGKGNKNEDVPYLMSRTEGTSNLHSAARKFFVPKRVTHNVLKNCLL